MNKLLAALIIFSACHTAMAAEDYNKPPAGDKQYAACVKRSNDAYDGGNDQSPVRGQTKAQAFCTCLWNETPEDFTGGLAKFSETAKGKTLKTQCEKHADWS